MSKINYEEREKMIRTEWFKDHRAVFSDCGMFKTLEWGNPGTSNYWLRAIISKRTLIIYGDIGDAIYQWSQELDWQWLSGLGLGYFSGKCQASEEGRQYVDWDDEAAQSWLETCFKDEEEQRAADMEEWDEDKRKAYAEKHPTMRQRFEDASGAGNLFSQMEWNMFLHDNGHEIFGDDLSSVAECGQVIAQRCQAHLIAIKMAVESVSHGLTTVATGK